MKRLLLPSLVFLLSSNLWAYTKGKTYKLTILHTNDHHGRFWPNKDGELGLAPRATLIHQIREDIKRDGGHVLLLDAGDVNTGVPQSDLQDAEPDFKGMALLGYDVMAVGNHEFDNPLETVMKQREWAGFPFVSANIYKKETNERIFPTHVVKELDDLKVTIFGLTTEDTPLKSSLENTRDLKFVPAVEEAKALVPTLRPNTDVLIALTHIGHYPNETHGADAPGDVTLARQVNGIDVIVGGHTQLPVFQPDVQNGSVIVQAGEWGKYLGRIDFEFLDGKLTLKDYKLIPINLKGVTEKIEPDQQIVEFLRPFKELGDRSIQIDLGTTDGLFVGDRGIIRSQETNLGNLVTLAYKEKVNADLAISNSGGIRDSIPAGKITYESVLLVLPFANELAIAELTGAELTTYLEQVIFTLLPGSGSYPQFSGVEIVASNATKKITSLKIGGQPVCPAKKYVMAIPTFIAQGQDKYPAVTHRKTGFVDADILKDYILKKKDLKVSDYAPTGDVKLID